MREIEIIGDLIHRFAVGDTITVRPNEVYRGRVQTVRVVDKRGQKLIVVEDEAQPMRGP